MAQKKALVVKKPWGNFTQFTHNEKTTVKIITVNKGGVLSLQSHRKRKELWVALDDGLTATIKGKSTMLRKGGMLIVPLGAKHRLAASKKARLLEISFGKFDEKDIIRYEDKYGRV